jgi:TolB-like protein
MRISPIRSNLLNRSATLLNFCMVGFEVSLFFISTQTGKSTEAFDSQMALITDKIAEAVTEVKLKAVTVAGFTDLHDKESDLGLFLADQVSAGLVQKGCEVVDRNNVARILAEHQLTASGLVDPENAKKLGQFAGLDAIVIGTITPLSGTIRVTVKVLATDSAKLLAATSADIPKTNSIRDVMGEPEIAEPTPTPQLQRGALVQPQAHAASDEVRPSLILTNEQATTAFNYLQDTLQKPHAKSVSYDSSSGSYSWIGPQYGERMLMPRGQFEAEIWQEFIKPHPTEILVPQPPDQLVQKEEVSPITYIGHVGHLDAIFFLKWLPRGKIQGTYFFPKRGINRSYTLLGENSEGGKIYLEEYTDKELTARIGLVKSTAAGDIVWEGVMQNVDGRRFDISFRRDR